MGYTYLETEEEIKHGDDEDAELKYEDMLLKSGAITEDETVEGQARLEAAKSVAKEQRKTDMRLVICSCGSPRCYAIKHFGLPKPLFQEHILPIGSQMVRDTTAARMKQERDLN